MVRTSFHKFKEVKREIKLLPAIICFIFPSLFFILLLYSLFLYLSIYFLYYLLYSELSDNFTIIMLPNFPVHERRISNSYCSDIRLYFDSSIIRFPFSVVSHFYKSVFSSSLWNCIVKLLWLLTLTVLSYSLEIFEWYILLIHSLKIWNHVIHSTSKWP